MNQSTTRNSASRVLHWTVMSALAASATTLSIAAHAQASPDKAAYKAKMAQEALLHPVLATGSAAPDFNLPGVDGKHYSLADFKKYPILAVIFTCDHCPTAQLYEGRIHSLVEYYRSKGVGFVAIQPNAASAESLRELDYTDVGDTLPEMKIRSDYRHFNLPYLYDGDSQSVAQTYGPKATPHIFIFDKDRKLRYDGRIDDNQRESLVKTHDARNALDAMLSGQPVAVAHTPAMGCSTKWKDETEMKQRETLAFQALPVDLAPVTAQDLAALRANNTDKTVMVAFWATWCGPCAEEYPDLLQTYLQYRSRDFDFVSVSVNNPDEKAAVLKFLQKEHSAIRNLQFASEDMYAMQAAFDKQWESGVPFTIVIAPGGKVIYQEEGEIHLLALRRAILANLPDMGYIGNAAHWAQK